MTQPVQKARLQTLYHTERAKSSIDDAPFFKFGEIVWGTGFVREDGSGGIIFDDIPANVSQIQGEVFRNNPVKSVANDKILLSATFPKDKMPTDGNKKLTTLYQLDAKGNIIIVFTFAPVWTSPTRDINLSAEIAIGDA
ncbi:hypothetical protein [Vibrio europaeus]|uniref:hypothetical protein n=1 Tax=Vibrio europaeus TaxID=300876 RepID=UPI00233F34EA|nr:hypothetical protein [Vibrio europaeus]MDC5753522.1 hypothetical protein [Vibrio europaeus]MDC5816565.1 hypothetical protein [Vibrio europaeus]